MDDGLLERLQSKSFRYHAEGTIADWEFYPPRNEFSSEESLLAAVLQDAIYGYLALSVRDDLNPQERRELRELRNWFLSPDSDSLFSFRSICDHFHYDPGFIDREMKNGVKRVYIGVRVRRKRAAA